jgi:SAM-dependent methyltransferase
MDDHDIRRSVRDNYAQVAVKSGSCCGPSSCCRPGAEREQSLRLGYSEEDLAALPEGANLGLGCGNPVAISSLQEGETVLDLGSGAGIDCFIAAARVGSSGRVIGVDMTPEMLDKARANASKSKHDNIEFRLGELEHLPVADGEVNVVISNCVINLVPDKSRAFGEAYRALAPGGRLAVSDIVLLAPLPEKIAESVAAYTGCIAGALLKDDYLSSIRAAGFDKVEVIEEIPAAEMIGDAFDAGTLEPLGLTKDDIADAAASVVSVKVSAVKP